MKIVDRVVSALLSLAVIPVAIFVPMLHWVYQIMGYDIVNSLLGGNLTEAGDTGMTEDNYSLYALYNQLKSFGIDFKEMLSGNTEINPAAEPIIPYIKMTVVFLIVTLLIALVTGIVSAVSNAKKTQMILGACGIGSLIGMMVSFNKFASPIVSGNITLGSLFDIPVISFITRMHALNLSTAWVFMVMLFAALILWNLSYILTGDKENTIKKQGKKS